MADALLMRLKDPKMFQDYSNEWYYIIDSPYTVLHGYMGTDTDIVMPSVVEGHKTALYNGWWTEYVFNISPYQITSLTFPKDYILYENSADYLFYCMNKISNFP